MRLARTVALAVVLALLPLGARSQTHHSPEDESHGAAGNEGFLGSYPSEREATGTSWQPDSTPMEAIHFRGGGFDMMLHGFLNVGYSSESEPRGVSEGFTTGMIGFFARRDFGKGTLGFRLMGSSEPVMGPTGYPLLLQTGETADGTTPLLDRQHPHDVLMETAVTYSHEMPRESSLFVYFAPVGEPALGPPAFMHRASNGDNPFAPIVHHWLDSTHISYGVLTFGWIASNKAKIEASIFNGREPDEDRWDVDRIRLDSYSVRFTANPTPDWSFQASFAELNEPEALHEGIDFLRITASLTYNRRRERGNWQTTAAWGRNKRERTALTIDPVVVLTHSHGVTTTGVSISPVLVQNSLLVESALRFRDDHTAFARFEWAEKDELFAIDDPRHSALFDVSKLNVGYSYDFVRVQKLAFGAGVAFSLHFLPDELSSAYGESPTGAYGFLRLKIR